MADKAQMAEANAADPADTPAAAAPAAGTPAPRRSPGHRGADMRDTMAELAARAQEISQDAGSKIAGAMKEVIGAAAGLTGFAVESARDLVQYLVRRGQMSQEEADRVIREAEEAAKAHRPAAAHAAVSVAPASRGPAIKVPVAVEPPPSRAAAAPAKAAAPAVKSAAPAKVAAPVKAAPPAKPAAKAPAKPAAKSASKAPAKPAAKVAKAPAKAAAKKPAAKKPAPKKAAAKKR
jgi:hypothetical protein